MNFAQYLDINAETHADRTALVFGEERLSYKELNQQVNRVANGLSRLGVNKGQVVSYLLPNPLQSCLCLFGIMKTGAMPNPLILRFTPDEIVYQATDAGPDLLVVDSSLEELAGKVKANVKSIRTVVNIGELLKEENTQFNTVYMHWSDPGLLIYTAGTTGKPKGVEHSHGSWEAGCRGEQISHGLIPEYKRVHPFPLYWGGGILSLTASLRAGITLVLLEKWNALKWWETVQKEKISFLDGFPVFYHDVLDVPDNEKYDTSSIKFGVCGGHAMPDGLEQKFMKRFGGQVINVYGGTETATVITRNRVTRPSKTGSVGQAMWELGRIKIVDPDTEQEVPTGEIGEILVQGDQVMMGYHNQPELTVRVLRGGWYHTSDLGRVDEEGYLFLVDRADDMIKCSGINIFPAEVEHVLSEHPAIAQVAVVDEPDDRKGKIPVAYVVLRPGHATTEEDVKNFFLERAAPYKHPRKVYFVDELPLTSVGKMDKKRLRKSAHSGVTH